ncbi:Peroxiredoxin [Duganella sp. CF402]|uniref:redoxin domain-containing protein n=1 Tax=unclassified Duganella TaxID=2636909 RepID=UPI0008BD4BF0|nr:MULTISPECIES: redoxin domain-containing protein [unclassified Duganella]RZT09833.1 peroxiredoxin [Duganella sp. BK701]SEL40934.1 Peroxiredoxin [Duganella sp. CF402]
MFPIATELRVAEWLNTAKPLSLRQLRGKVVAIYAFQMLCPGCVSHGIPQAKSIRAVFDEQDVAVLGLHSVFEHHAVMNRAALDAFVHEYRIGFPVAIDQPSTDGTIPLTMEQYQLRGTPTLILIDRQGRLRLSHFGRAEDMQVGALISQLVAEPAPQQARCDDDVCSIR